MVVKTEVPPTLRHCRDVDVPRGIKTQKDVAAFLGWVALPFATQGPWKIYGNAEPSLRLAATHRRCREHMARQLAAFANPFECLQGAAQQATKFALAF